MHSLACVKRGPPGARPPGHCAHGAHRRPGACFSAELSVGLVAVVAISYCHRHHMLDLSVSKKSEGIHLLLTYDGCKTDCVADSGLQGRVEKTRPLFKATCPPRHPATEGGAGSQAGQEELGTSFPMVSAAQPSTGRPTTPSPAYAKGTGW